MSDSYFSSLFYPILVWNRIGPGRHRLLSGLWWTIAWNESYLLSTCSSDTHWPSCWIKTIDGPRWFLSKQRNRISATLFDSNHRLLAPVCCWVLQSCYESSQSFRWHFLRKTTEIFPKRSVSLRTTRFNRLHTWLFLLWYSTMRPIHLFSQIKVRFKFLTSFKEITSK